MLTVIALVEDLFGVGVEVVAWARSAKALWILPVEQAAESASGFTRGPEAQPSTCRSSSTPQEPRGDRCPICDEPCPEPLTLNGKPLCHECWKLLR